MISRRTTLLGLTSLAALPACRTVQSPNGLSADVEVFDDEVLALIPRGAELETLATGYTWSEGPTWDRSKRALYFTDVPGNTAYRWTREAGVDVLLQPSGAADAAGFREPGANGLWYARDGRLIVCNHGLRRVETIELQSGRRTPLATSYGGRRFNSPNDVVQARDNTLYFTDPPYGLEGLNASPLKEMPANGVYRLRTDGRVERLLDDMTFPNGVALSLDERRLYISQSDPDAPLIRVLTLGSSGAITDDTVFFDAAPLMGDAAPGLPDGMAISQDGYLFATGPGGVLILSPDGRLIGRIRTGRATANCAFGEDGQTLFITAHDRLLRMPTLKTGVQWS